MHQLVNHPKTLDDPQRQKRELKLTGLRHLLASSASLIIFGAVVGFLILGVLLPGLPSSRLTLHVDILTSKGSSLELYLNTLSIPPQVQPLQAGRRASYHFGVPYASIDRIRMDVIGGLDDAISVYSISVTGTHGRVVAHYGPSKLATWARYSMTTPAPNTHALAVTSTAQDASIDAFRSISDTHNLPFPLGTLVRDARSSGTRLELAIWGSAIVGGLVLLLGRQSRLVLLAGITLGIVSMAALYEATHHPGAATSPMVAVGASAFFGFSLTTNTHAIYAMYSGVLIVAVAFVILVRLVRGNAGIHGPATGRGWRTWRSRLKEPEPLKDAGAQHHRHMAPGRSSWFVVVFSLVLVVAAFLPDLRQLVASTKVTQYSNGFDSTDLLAWTAFASRGLVPMKDFWYPYGNDLIFQSSLFGGPMLYFLYQAVGVAGYGLVFWRLSGRRAVVTCLALLGLVLAGPLIGEFPRYGFAFMIGLVFCVVRATPSSRARLWSRVALTVIVAMAAFIEPDLLAYAGTGVLIAMLFDAAARIWRPSPKEPAVESWRSWLRGLSYDLAGPAAAILAAVVVSAVRGQLGNMVAFYGQPGTLSDYSAAGAPLFTGVRSLPSLNVMIVWLPAVLLGVAIVLRWGVGRSRDGLLAVMLAVVAGAGAVLLFKDAVRPLTGDLTLMLVVGLLLVLVAGISALLESGLRISQVAVGLVVGLLAASLAYSGEAPTLTSGVGAAPTRVYRDLVTVISPSSEASLVAKRRFSWFHFGAFPSELSLARKLRPLLGRSSSNLFVLGNNPIEYVLLNQEPPWQINAYNASPIRDQHQVIGWIAKHKPAVVVFDVQDGQTFDGVPNDVRIPLIYQAIARSYEPVTSVSGFDVLQRRKPGQKPAAKFWTSALGQVVNLGSIPDAEPPIPPASPEATSTPVLQVRATSTSPNEQVAVPLSFGGTAITVEFHAVAGRNTYDIPVDRLWPWALSHRVAIAGATTRGWAGTIVKGSMSANRLY